MNTAAPDLSGLDVIDPQRLRQMQQQMPIPEAQPPAPAQPQTSGPNLGSFEDLQQRTAQAPLQLGQALQNQQSQFGQTQDQLQQAQQHLADPYEQIQQGLANRLAQVNAERHLGVRGLLQNFFAGMSRGMMPIQQTPEFRQNQIIGQMIQVENARSLAGLRSAQTAQLEQVDYTMPDGTVVSVPRSQVGRLDAAVIRGQYGQQKTPTNVNEALLRRQYEIFQQNPGLSSDQMQQKLNSDPQFQGYLALWKQEQKPTATDTALANKEQYQTTVGKLAAAGLPTEPKSLPGSFSAGLKRGTITQQEYSDAMGYQAANQTPATNLQVHVEGAGAGKPATLEPQYIGYNPQTGQREMLPASQAKAVGMQGAMLAKEGDVDKYSTAQSQFNDVQANVSRYVAANNAYNQLPTSTRAKDAAALNTILNKAGIFDLKVSIGAGGSVEIPGLSAALEAASRETNSAAYNAMSPEAKDLMNGYLRTMAAVPAFVKALTNVGRTNKEIMDLELANIPNPTMAPGDIARKMQAFQENIDVAVKRLPRIPGIETTRDIRNQFEPQARPSVPANVQPYLQPFSSSPSYVYNPGTDSLIPRSQ